MLPLYLNRPIPLPVSTYLISSTIPTSWKTPHASTSSHIYLWALQLRPPAYPNTPLQSSIHSAHMNTTNHLIIFGSDKPFGKIHIRQVGLRQASTQAIIALCPTIQGLSSHNTKCDVLYCRKQEAWRWVQSVILALFYCNCTELS